LSNIVLLSQAARERCGWSLAAAKGTGLPTRAFVSASASGVFATPRPKPPYRPQAAVVQITGSKNQEMTRIAVNDGDQSGSHPAWDPV
jgi:hypothetical protein